MVEVAFVVAAVVVTSGFVSLTVVVVAAGLVSGAFDVVSDAFVVVVSDAFVVVVSDAFVVVVSGTAVSDAVVSACDEFTSLVSGTELSEPSVVADGRDVSTFGSVIALPEQPASVIAAAARHMMAIAFFISVLPFCN